MALSNFTLPFSAIGGQSWATISPLQQHATAVNNLLYGPAGHQELDDLPPEGSHDQYYKNDPYAPPSQLTTQHHQQQYIRRNNEYLPPPPQQRQQQQPQQLAYNTQSTLSQQQTRSQQQQQPQQRQFPQTQTTRTYSEGSYSNLPPQRNVPNTQYFNSFNSQQPSRVTYPQTVTPQPSQLNNGQGEGGGAGGGGSNGGLGSADTLGNNIGNDPNYPSQNPSFTRVQAGQGSRTQVHAVLDYDADEDDYYDEDDHGSPVDVPESHKGSSMPTVTPIQGPIFLKNGTVPVVPLFSYPTTNNGSFVQIPIWWTALSVALGLEIRGDLIQGTPCVKRFNQLFCPTAGNSYPIDRIESFIDDNKALMRRMYGDFQMTSQYGPPLQQNSKKRKRDAENIDLDDIPGVPDFIGPPGSGPDPIRQASAKGDSYFSKLRDKRQSSNQGFGRQRTTGSNTSSSTSSTRPSIGPNPQSEPNTGRVDACESKIEIVTPYWASNSAGKIRAIVNTQHFEQAIHQEVCTKMQTSRCGGDCGCEQKYKWHRLLAYDPDNDCKGIFMDWFLFPSCCVCRCSP